MLLPASLPGALSRSGRFDALVLAAVEHLEDSWAAQLREVEFAVEDVPMVSTTAPEQAVYDAGVLDDHAVPLAQVFPGVVDPDGGTVAPRIVLYRRPLEIRAVDDGDLADIVHDVVVEQVASLLGISPDEVDPPG